MGSNMRMFAIAALLGMTAGCAQFPGSALPGSAWNWITGDYGSEDTIVADGAPSVPAEASGPYARADAIPAAGGELAGAGPTSGEVPFPYSVIIVDESVAVIPSASGCASRDDYAVSAQRLEQGLYSVDVDMVGQSDCTFADARDKREFAFPFADLGVPAGASIVLSRS